MPTTTPTKPTKSGMRTVSGRGGGEACASSSSASKRARLEQQQQQWPLSVVQQQQQQQQQQQVQQQPMRIMPARVRSPMAVDAQQQQQMREAEDAGDALPTRGEYIANSPHTMMIMTMTKAKEAEFERDDAERNLFFHTLLKHVLAQLVYAPSPASASASEAVRRQQLPQRFTLKREARDCWTVMGQEPAVWVQFSVQHLRAFVAMHPEPILATKSTYSIELLMPGPGCKLEGFSLMPTTTPEHVQSALMRLSSAMFQ
jgi:hypothetical protein